MSHFTNIQRAGILTSAINNLRNGTNMAKTFSDLEEVRLDILRDLARRSRWEYASISWSTKAGEPPEDALAPFGTDGWELAAVIPVAGTNHMFRAFFKRLKL